MKIKYPIRLWFSVVGMAAPNETNANSVAEQRAVNVKDMTDLFGMGTTASEVKSYVNSRHEADMSSDHGAVVLIDMNPGCPNDCCDAITAPNGETSGLPQITR